MTNQSAAESRTTIELDLWGDLVSPWCWIAKRRIEKAIHAFERPHDVTVRYRAFEIDPDLPMGGGVPLAEHIGSRRGGGVEAGRRMLEQAARDGADDDLWFDFDRALRANTFDAHRLCALALEMGGLALQGAVVERFFAAHFREGLALDDPEVLQRISAEAGLDERRVSSVLAGKGYTDWVRGDEEMAAERGITAVPYVLANGEAALEGPASVEAYLSLLRGVAVGSPDE
jgi:predicted DsbA family dithiol-disulfide isomerase